MYIKCHVNGVSDPSQCVHLSLLLLFCHLPMNFYAFRFTRLVEWVSGISYWVLDEGTKEELFFGWQEKVPWFKGEKFIYLVLFLLFFLWYECVCYCVFLKHERDKDESIKRTVLNKTYFFTCYVADSTKPFKSNNVRCAHWVFNMSMHFSRRREVVRGGGGSGNRWTNSSEAIYA